MVNKIPPFLLSLSTPGSLKKGAGKIRAPFLERGTEHLAGVIKNVYAQWEFSFQKGFFQKIDARIKVLFLLFFILIVSLKRDLLPEVYIWVFVFGLTLFSCLSILRVYKRIIFLGFVFGFLIALPSAFNVITKGEIVLPVARLSRPYNILIYHIPADIGITREGIYGVAMLTMRVINSLSLSFLVLYTTPFHEIVIALKVLKVPDSFLIILTLCYKYIFIFSKTVEDMHLAKKSRMVRELSNSEAREWITGRIAFIFQRSQRRFEEVYRAMVSRGFTGKVKNPQPQPLRSKDLLAGIFLLLTGILFLLI